MYPVIPRQSFACGACVWKGLRGKRTLEVGQVRLLVELGARVAEGADDVVDLDGRVLESLLALLGGSVGAGVCRRLVLVCLAALTALGTEFGVMY